MHDDAPIDVLIVTALQDELEAVLGCGERGRAGWADRRDAHGFQFHTRNIGELSFAASWTGQMGETAAAVRCNELIAFLKPRCVAMSGICAGKKGDVFLGDVIVADRVYSYDHGKLRARDPGKAGTLYQDIETYNLEQTWKVDAAYLARDPDLRKRLRRRRPRSLRAQREWLLAALYTHQWNEEDAPPELSLTRWRAMCPQRPKVVELLERDRFVKVRGEALALTGAGQAYVQEAWARDPDWPRPEPSFTVHVGPIATGKTVQKDPELFSRLERSVRKTLGVEMEAAAIGYVAERRDVSMLIAKAVSDYGDEEKDDAFRNFACRVSATFVVEFLKKYFPPSQQGRPRMPLDRVPEVAVPGDPAAFSPGLIHQMARLHKKIERLTEEQCRVIEFLEGRRRVAISGCAGSGKTLVAAEKAIRLARAGLKTLLLCHNPALAGLMRTLTIGTQVEATDFESWVRMLNGHPAGKADEWMHYEEPSEVELNSAFDHLVRQRDLYDAVIVDEGQDFRETWWTLVEAATRPAEAGILYVFLDDNQTLLPHRGRLPFEESPYRLTRNCRNAGAIFSVVKRLHPCAPETSVELARDGRVERFPAAEGNARESVAQALKFALGQLDARRLVVLTTESDPASHSFLEGLRVTPDSRWQDMVMDQMRGLLARYGPKPNRPVIKLPELSTEPLPTPQDVSAVHFFVQRLMIHAPTSIARLRRARWRVSANGLALYEGARVPGSAGLATFFGWTDWSEGLPAPAVYELRTRAGDDASAIPLRTVASFKGLESDGIVLYLRESLGSGPLPDDPQRMALAYVGISRARALLCIVGEWPVLNKV